MSTPTLQPDTRSKATGGAAASTAAYNTFVKDLGAKLRENVSFASMAADPVMKPRMLNTVRNSLLGAVPDFHRLNETDQLQFTERALNEALQPTTGERVQKVVEGVAPIVPPAVAAASGGNIPATMVAAGVGSAIPEITRPLLTSEPFNFADSLRRVATNTALVGAGEAAIRPIGSAVGAWRSRQVLGEGPALEQTKSARQVLEPGLREKGYFLTPKQLSREHLPPVTEFVENIAESGLGGRGVMQGQRMATDDVIAKATVELQKHLEQGLATNEEAATLFLNHAHSRELYMRTISSMKHRIVDDIARGRTAPEQAQVVMQRLGVTDTDDIVRDLFVPPTKQALTISSSKPLAAIQATAKARGLSNTEMAAVISADRAADPTRWSALPKGTLSVVDDWLSRNGLKGPTTIEAKPIIDLVGLRNDPTTKAVLSNFKVPELRDNSGKLLRQGYSGPDGFYEMLNGAGPRQLSFGDADRARSVLLGISRDFGGPTASGSDKQVAKLAGTMAERLRTGMDTAARKLDPKAADAYASAKEFHRTQVIEKFDDAIYKGIIKSIEKEPGKFAQYALSPENVDKLKVLKEMSGEGQLGAWPEVQGRLLQHIVSKAAEKESLGMGLDLGQVVEQGLLRKVSGDSIRSSIKALGPEGEKVLLGGPPGEAFRRFTNALEVGAARPEGPGKIGTIMMQFGAMSTLGAGAGGLAGGLISGGDWAAVSQGAVAGATAVLLTPRAFAKIMTNEKLMRNIADGVIGGPKSVAFGRMVTNIGLLNDEIQRSVGGSVADVVRGATAPSAQLTHPAGTQLSQSPAPAAAPGITPP